jgi:peptide/nickel transport system substrate-binding protein
VLPVDAPPGSAAMGPEHGKWFASNGASGRKPTDPHILRMLELFRSAASQTMEERIKTAQEIWKIEIDQQYGIGTVGQSPALMGVRLVSTRLGNIPSRNCIAQHCRTPGGAHPETWFYKN